MTGQIIGAMSFKAFSEKLEASTKLPIEEHTLRALTGYIPSVIRNTHQHDHPPPVEWSVLYTGAYNTQVHTMGNARPNNNHACALEWSVVANIGETHTMGGGVPPHQRNLQLVHICFSTIYVLCAYYFYFNNSNHNNNKNIVRYKSKRSEPLVAAPGASRRAPARPVRGDSSRVDARDSSSWAAKVPNGSRAGSRPLDSKGPRLRC